MNNRNLIESSGRCDWFDKTCPNCKCRMKAYQGVSFGGDYALLCYNCKCENYFKCAIVGDMIDEIQPTDFSDIGQDR